MKSQHLSEFNIKIFLIQEGLIIGLSGVFAYILKDQYTIIYSP